MYYLAFGGADGLQKPGDDAVCAEQLNGALVDGVEDFLGGGFTCEQDWNLGTMTSSMMVLALAACSTEIPAGGATTRPISRAAHAALPASMPSGLT